jgi:hypothetical protein
METSQKRATRIPLKNIPRSLIDRSAYPLNTYRLTEDRIFLMSFCTSLEGQTVMSLSAYATSSFSKHSLISTVLVVQNVVNGKMHRPSLDSDYEIDHP